MLDEFRRTAGDTALRAAIARRGEELTARSTAMLEGDGRLHGYLAEWAEATAEWAEATAGRVETTAGRARETSRRVLRTPLR